ncbi:MAG: hypothetical protein ABSD98_11070 [Candidatus Korobacteraceae bacterium]
MGIAAPLATAMRPIAFLRRYWDFLAVLLLMAASLPLSWFSPHTVILVQHPGAFDDHWVLDSAFKSSRGIIFGRDVAFVYGPVFQWLMAAPARWPNFSMGSVYVSNRTLLLWCTFLFAHGTLRLLLPEQPAWKRFLLLVLLAIFWAPWDGRTACAIFLFALFLRGWYAVRDQRLKPLLFAGGCALLTAVAFLYSADTGVYGVAAWLLGLGGVAWEGRESRKFARCAAVAAGGFAVCLAALVLVINSIMAAPLDFRFWRTSLALVAVHRWNEPYPISAMGALHLLAPVVIGACLFLVRFAVPADRTAVITARTGFLLSAFLFALLSTQSGLIRSDYNHIVFGVYPMVFFAGAVLFSFPSRAASAVAALAAVACSLVFSQPALQFQPSNIRYRLTRMRHPITGCPGGFREFDRVCYPSGFAGTLETTVGYLQRHSGENDSVLIFPYQYMFAVAAQRNVAAGVEQSFLANGPYLSQFDTAGMERAQAQAGLYFPDAGPAELTSPTLSLPIDEVSNFTRTPDIWFWIFRHYRSDEELAPGILALQWDDSRQARISVQDYPLAVVARDFPIYAPTAAIDLGAPDWPAGGADFLRLRMTIRYSPLWKLRKPERLQLEITLADGSRSLRTFVAEPNVASDVWFYPWNQADLAGYFAGDEGRWRAAPRPAVTSLRLLITPLDWFSQQPESVEIDSVDAVRLSMRQ